MAELLLRIVDKVNPNHPDLDAMCLKRGDVVTVQDDGWPWSPAELEGVKAIAAGATLAQAALLQHPWLVVKVPGIPASTLSAFIAADGGDPQAGTLPQRRAFRFDVVRWVSDGMPTLNAIKALAYKVTKPPRKVSL